MEIALASNTLWNSPPDKSPKFLSFRCITPVNDKASLIASSLRFSVSTMVLTENLKEEAINEALSLTGVIHLKDKNLGDLSGGEFQRVLLARAISKKPDLLVLDEPVHELVHQALIDLVFWK